MLDLDDWPDLKQLHPRRRQVAPPCQPTKTRASRLRRSSPRRAPILDLDDHTPAPIRRGSKRPRQREEADVFGQTVPPRKRRRLRHAFTTSRLSANYAVPSTHVPSRKSLREGIWARQRVSGRDLLRKAAIFNAMSKNRKGGRKTEARLFITRTVTKHSMIAPIPADEFIRSPSSSKNSIASDYDIFDFEDDSSSQDEEDELEPAAAIHSDFNKLQEPPCDSEISLEGYSFDGPPSLGSDDVYTFDPGGKVLSMFLENEKTSEVSHAPRML